MREKFEKAEDLKAQEQLLKDTSALSLPSDVATGYKVAPGIVRVFVDAATGGLIDLNSISVVQAEKLAARGILIKI